MISTSGLNQVVRGPATYVTTHLAITGSPPPANYRSELQLDADKLADPTLTFGVTLEFSNDDLSQGPPVNWTVIERGTVGCGVPSRAGGIDTPAINSNGVPPSQAPTAIRSTLIVPDGINIALGVLLSAS